jgi:hypothetical protein
MWRKHKQKEVGEGIIQQLGSAENLMLTCGTFRMQQTSASSPAFKFEKPDTDPCDPSGYGIHTEFQQPEMFVRE